MKIDNKNDDLDRRIFLSDLASFRVVSFEHEEQPLGVHYSINTDLELHDASPIEPTAHLDYVSKYLFNQYSLGTAVIAIENLGPFSFSLDRLRFLSAPFPIQPNCLPSHDELITQNDKRQTKPPTEPAFN